jgi:hypothetical protein
MQMKAINVCTLKSKKLFKISCFFAASPGSQIRKRRSREGLPQMLAIWLFALWHKHQ